MSGEFRTYLVAQLPGWAFAALVAAALLRWTSVSPRLVFGALALWVIKDLLLFPFLRRFYRPDPAERRIVGLRGVAVSGIAPRGLVRVRGELWQAESDAPIAEGAAVRVVDVDGLRLRVESEAAGT